MNRKNKFYLLLKTTTMMGALIMPVLAGGAVAQDKGMGDINPISGWTVNPMAQNTDNAYCALSRQYDQNLVLTLGQSVSEEYSLAIDFLDASLNVDKAYDVTLQPGPGQIRAYEMMPASARAMVVRIGFDESFMSALEQSESLKAEIEGKVYHFNVTGFADAQADLRQCMTTLGDQTKIKVASNDFQAQKIENASPLPVVEDKSDAEASTTELKAQEQEPSPQNTISISKAVDDLTVQPIEAAIEVSPQTPRPPIVMERVSKAIEDVQPDRNMLDKPTEPIVMNKVSSQILDQQLQPPISLTSVQEEQREQAQELIKAQEEAADKARQKEQELAAQKAEELERKAQEIARQQEIEKAEKEKLARTEVQRLEQEKLVLEQRQEAERMKAQKRQEEKIEQERLAEEARRAEDKAKELAKFKEENERLARSMAEQEKKLVALDTTKNTTREEIDEIKARMKELEEENRKLYLEARQARAEIDKAVVNTSNEALEKMREYEEKLNAARADNIALSKEIEEMRSLKESGSLKAVSGDWDLERATQRYNEAEREIKRLGLLLEQQRIAHRQEKAELEEMLFDPVVSDKEQRRRLTELELKLEAAERQLAASGSRMRDLSSMPAVPAPSVYSSDTAERTGFSPLPALSASNQIEKDSVLESIRAEQMEINRLNAEIKNAQQVEPKIVSSIPRLEDTPTSISVRPAPPPVSVSSRASVPEIVSAPVSQPVFTQTNRPIEQVVSRSPEPQMMQAPIKSPEQHALGKDELRDVLLRSGLTINGDVNERGPGQYQWLAGNLKGQAQIVPVSKAGSIDQFISSFMELSQKACKGDFASLPAPDVSDGRAFEVACITPQSNMSSSLIFKQMGSDVIVIGHEISADDMDIAMDIRDRIAEKL